MQEFPIIPFSKEENTIKYSLNEFKELKKPFAVLVHTGSNLMPETNNYRFGVISEKGEMSWFFNGMATTNDRMVALEAFQGLLQYCNAKKLGKPFAYKEYKKRE